MLSKLKIWIDVFGKITIGILTSAAVFVTMFWGRDSEIEISILGQILFVSFVCSLGVFMFPGEGERELSKKGMFVRKIIYFVFVNAAVLGLGFVFDWFQFSNIKMVLLMELLIIAVFAAVWSASYFGGYVVAQNMNRKLKEKQENKE